MRIEKPDGNTSGGGAVKMVVTFDRSALSIMETPFGMVVELEGCQTAGELGGPGLPARVVRVAVPPATRPVSVRAKVLAHEQVHKGPALLAPVQKPRPGGGPRGQKQEGSHEKPEPEDRQPHLRPSSTMPIEEPLVEPVEPQPFEPPRPDLYEREVRKPRPTARLVATEWIGLTPTALVELNPIAVGKKGELELATKIELEVQYAPGWSRREDDKGSPGPLGGRIVSRGQAERLTELARTTVVNADLVVDLSHVFPQLITNIDYLIITDDQRWSAEEIQPLGPIEDGLVGEFTRLATWKAKRGLRTRVVTVSQIVSGTYGDFKTGARDLQEVIRNFVKWAYDNWGISWLLLGGDVDIIPARSVAGAAEAIISPASDDPPPKNQSYWTGTFLKMHVDRPGWDFPGSVAGLPLVRPDNGLLIPFDAAGTSGPTSLGWHFCTNDTYTVRSSTPTKYIRVNGPSADVDSRMQWLYLWNMIPTDLYYANLTGPTYNVPGGHDWDLLDNGIYGQHTNNTDLDGVSYQADISVGRAPVATTTQASAFVDKVVAYESFRQPNGAPLGLAWTRRLLMVSANWGGRRDIWQTGVTPPGDDKYYHAGGSDHSLIKLKEAFTGLDRRLLVEVTATDVRLMPYNRSAATAGRGWHYAVSSTNLAPSETTFSFLGTTIHIPTPTEWVVVYGQPAELTPNRYIFDQTKADGSLRDQEKLRQQLATDFPQVNDVSRLYEDEVDLTPAQLAAAPVQHLTEDRLRDKLNAGQHFVSLSGHGNPNGCCTLSAAMAQNLTNGSHSFIGYADSCLTSRFDGEDAMSEHLLYNPNGGAVAYVGNTRFSWIGVGDDFQRAFFDRLTSCRHLGLLNDVRCTMVNASTGYYRLYNKWAIFSLNLMGDPEMPIWTGPPKTMIVSFEREVDNRYPFIVSVRRGSPGFGWPLQGAKVTVQQGSFLRQATTDYFGRAVFDIGATKLGDLELTVTKLGYIPVIETVEIVGPAWVSGFVKVIAHQHRTPDSTYVRLELAQEIDGRAQRGWYARDALRDYSAILDAVTDAYIAEKKIHLLVNNIKEGGTIERFRFGRWPLLKARLEETGEVLAISEAPTEDGAPTLEVAPSEESKVVAEAITDRAAVAPLGEVEPAITSRLTPGLPEHDLEEARVVPDVADTKETQGSTKRRALLGRAGA